MKIACIIPKYAAPITDPCCYPLGYGYIISVLVAAWHDVDVYNLNLHAPPSPNDLLKYDNVLMAGFDESADQIRQLAYWCKQSGIRTVLGHGMATYHPQQMAEYYDAVCVGEAESCILDALKIDGIHYGRPLPLDALPTPDYHRVGIDEYHRRHSHKYMGILTSRGCPHACTFCANLCTFRCRSLAKVEAEICDYKAKYGIERLVVYDNTLNASDGRFRRFIDIMAKKGLSWSCCLRADHLSEENVIKAKDSGLEYVLLGIESLRQSKLDEFNKGVTVEQIYRAMDIFAKHGVSFVGGAFIGTGADTFDDVLLDLQLLKESGHNIAPNTLTEFPGVIAKRSPHLSPAEHDFLEMQCLNYRIQNGIPYVEGTQPSAVLGMLC